jgi:hypothetical protein
VEKLEGKRLFLRPGCRWEDNIKMGLKEVGWKRMACIHLAEGMDE